MSRLHRLVACAVALGLLVLGLSAGALASGGTTTSAGDQQYVDPLTSTTHTSSGTATPTQTAPASSAASTGTTPAPAAGATSTTSAATTVSATSTSAAHTLPFTGLNMAGILAVGLGLLGTGLVLRRLSARASDHP